MRTRTLRRSPRSSTSGELNLDLHPKQWVAFESEATEILYGGAAWLAPVDASSVPAGLFCGTRISPQLPYLRGPCPRISANQAHPPAADNARCKHLHACAAEHREV